MYITNLVDFSNMLMHRLIPLCFPTRIIPIGKMYFRIIWRSEQRNGRQGSGRVDNITPTVCTGEVRHRVLGIGPPWNIGTFFGPSRVDFYSGTGKQFMFVSVRIFFPRAFLVSRGWASIRACDKQGHWIFVLFQRTIPSVFWRSPEELFPKPDFRYW